MVIKAADLFTSFWKKPSLIQYYTKFLGTYKEMRLNKDAIKTKQ